MNNIALILGITAAIIAIAISGITLWLQQRNTTKIQSQQEAWERAQEVRQQRWRTQQEHHHSDFEKYLATKTQHIQAEWQQWEQNATRQATAIEQQFTTLARQIQLENELARIPRVEDVPLTHNTGALPGQGEPLRPPLHLSGVDLSERDLSSRYLCYADLRGAQLVNARLYMSDLSWACLIGANLSGADLSATNLTHADLRGANLTGANLLVADMHNAILIGANLLNAHSLTPEQVHTTIYDGTTIFDENIALTALPTPLRQQPAALSLTTSITEENTEHDVAADPAELVHSSIVEEPQPAHADTLEDKQPIPFNTPEVSALANTEDMQPSSSETPEVSPLPDVEDIQPSPSHAPELSPLPNTEPGIMATLPETPLPEEKPHSRPTHHSSTETIADEASQQVSSENQLAANIIKQPDKIQKTTQEGQDTAHSGRKGRKRR